MINKKRKGGLNVYAINLVKKAEAEYVQYEENGIKLYGFNAIEPNKSPSITDDPGLHKISRENKNETTRVKRSELTN